MDNDSQYRPLEEIVAEVARHFGLEPEDLTGPRRTKTVAQARHIAIHAMRQTGATLREIGNALGGRDPRTVLYHWHKVKKERRQI